MAQIVAALTKIVTSVAKIAGHLLHTIQDARQCISTDYRTTISGFDREFFLSKAGLVKHSYLKYALEILKRKIEANDFLVICFCFGLKHLTNTP